MSLLLVLAREVGLVNLRSLNYFCASLRKGEAKPRSAEVADSGIAWHSLGTQAWSPDSSGTGILYPVINTLLSVLTPACVSRWLVLPRGRASREDACVSDGGARHGGGCLRARPGDRLLTGCLLCRFGCREAFPP